MNLVIQLEKQAGVQPPQVPSSISRLELEKHGGVFLGEEHFRGRRDGLSLEPLPQETHGGIDELVLLGVHVVNEGLQVDEAHAQVPPVRLYGELAARPGQLGGQAAGGACLEPGLRLIMLLCLCLLNRCASSCGPWRLGGYRERSHDVINDPLALDLVNDGPSVQLGEAGVLGDRRSQLVEELILLQLLLDDGLDLLQLLV
jgi:hypothetical protein